MSGLRTLDWAAAADCACVERAQKNDPLPNPWGISFFNPTCNSASTFSISGTVRVQYTSLPTCRQTSRLLSETVAGAGWWLLTGSQHSRRYKLFINYQCDTCSNDIHRGMYASH
jgi:hypothetical protein